MNTKAGKIVIKEEWKTAMLATWIGGLLAHAYRFFNFLPLWDSMLNFSGTGATYTSGRWFLDIVGKISSDYDMPWVNGALSLFYLGLIVIMLTELFELKSKKAIWLTAVLIVTFPTVTSSFAYMFTADGYMLAFLLAVLGIYLTEKYRYGFLCGMICICLSMSTYQAYLSVSLMLVVVICVKRILIEENMVWQVIVKEYKQAIALLAGAVLNNILTKLVNRCLGVVLDSYQGINDVHMLTLEDSIGAVAKVQLWFRMFFQIGEQRADNCYSILNQSIFLLLIILTICFIIKRKIYRRPLSVLCIIFAYWCIPILAYVIRFVSMEVSYHTLMVMSLCMIYVTLVIFIEHMKDKGRTSQVLKLISVIVLCGISYYNILNANYSYYNMNLSYEKSYAISADVLERIEELEDFDSSMKIAVIGTYKAETEEIAEEIPEIAGVSSDSFLRGQEHYLAMWEYCMGRTYTGASLEEVDKIKETETYLEMNTYPYAGSVCVIDDIVVVKLSE